MKLNVANPSTGAQKLLEYDDEKKMRVFFDKRISQEVELDSLGDEWKGYVARIAGGNDKQGFPMMQGVLTNHRVRLLLSKKHKCFRERRSGERKRKSIRGCITGPDLSVLSLVVVKKGPGEIPGLTDRELPQRLGPKRASKIRKLYSLSKDDDVRKYVVRRKLAKKKDTHKGKAPKIQRLITPERLQRKRRLVALKKRWATKSKHEAAEYAKLVAQRRKEAKTKRQALISRRRSDKKSGKADGTSAAPQATKAAPQKTDNKKKPATTPAAATGTQKPKGAQQPKKTTPTTAPKKTTTPAAATGTQKPKGAQQPKGAQKPKGAQQPKKTTTTTAKTPTKQ